MPFTLFSRFFFLFRNVTAQGKEGERSAGRDTTGQ